VTALAGAGDGATAAALTEQLQKDETPKADRRCLVRAEYRVLAMSGTLKLSRAVRSGRLGLRVRTLRDALRLIEKDLDEDVRSAPHWRYARARLATALRSRHPLTIEEATVYLERALEQEMAFKNKDPSRNSLARR
jgi:hypothetical protein